MFQVLRDTKSNICRPYYGGNLAGNPTTGSLVCQLSVDADKRVFWLTATPDPSISVFKPFQFSQIDCELRPTSSPAAFPALVKVVKSNCIQKCEFYLLKIILIEPL